LEFALAFAKAQDDSFEAKNKILNLLRKLISRSNEKLVHEFII